MSCAWLTLAPWCGLLSAPDVHWNYLGCFYKLPVPRSHGLESLTKWAWVGSASSIVFKLLG